MGTFVCSGDATRIFFGLTTYVSWGGHTDYDVQAYCWFEERDSC